MAPPGGTSVLSMAELTRIRDTVMTRTVTPGGQDRERLKKLSDERAGRWPNTIEAARERKERRLQERLDAEEAERCEVDRQEALIRAENRRLQIERANKMLYDETDRVKTFHSTLLLSDVIQERENQIKYKAKLKQVGKRQDAEFHKETLRALEAAEEAELRKLADLKRRALQQRDAQLTQLEEVKSRLISERQADKEEGELLKQKAKEAVVLLQQREAAKQARIQRMHAETEKANEALQKIKALEAQREREEEERIRVFAQRKEALILERKAREIQKAEEKEARRNAMVARMEADLLRRRQENERVAMKQAAEAQDKEANEAARRAEVRRVEQEATERSRAQQAALKRAAKDRARAEELELIEQMKMLSAMVKAEEEEERVQTYVRNKATQRYHLKQMARKREKAAYELARDRAEAEAQRLIMAEDDELFKQYTAVCMDEWVNDGKSLKPMQLRLAKVDSDLQPSC